MTSKQNNIISILDEIRNHNLYIHNEALDGVDFSIEKYANRKVYLVETLATLNAIVTNGTMLLYGGHGGGKTTLVKYLGQIFLGKTEHEIEEAILRGHPQLTEEKILGSLNFKQILSPELIPDDGAIEVQWNKFVNSTWKIIDEVNRLSPYAQNILLSLLAEGVVKYHNQSKQVGNFTVFATMNPPDEGNFHLPLPFMDRFAIALPITMPDYSSLQTIGMDIPQKRKLDFKLDKNVLDEIQEEVLNMRYSHDGEEFINIIITEFLLCVRTRKEANSTQTVDNGLCTNGEECRFNTDELVCNKIINPLSVRVKEDLFRYGKALAWFLGDKEVELKHIKALAPYMIWHRSNLSKKYKNENIKNNIQDDRFSINPELEGIKSVISLISKRYADRSESFMKDYNKAEKADLSIEELEGLIDKCQEVEDDLIIKLEVLPGLLRIKDVYPSIKKFREKIESDDNIDKLIQIQDDLSREYSIRIRQQLSNKIQRKISSLKSERFDKKKFTIDWTEKKDAPIPLIEGKLIEEYGEKLDFVIAKEVELSTNQDNYYLTVQPMTATILKFDYQGPEDSDIYIELYEVNK